VAWQEIPEIVVCPLFPETYNNGVAFVGMIPLITYDAGPIKLNAVYFPKIPNYNEIAAFGFYITLPLGRWLQSSLQKR
jgi:hypothetical protein